VCSIIQEGFLISGRVALWRIIQAILCNGGPIRRRSRIYEELAQLPVELRPLYR
jgi:hypothetical protein